MAFDNQCSKQFSIAFNASRVIEDGDVQNTINLIKDSLRFDCQNFEFSLTNRSFLLQLLDKKYFSSLVTIHQLVSSFNRNNMINNEIESYRLAQDVRSSLLGEWISEAESMVKILSDHHVIAVLIACDMIASQVYSPIPTDDESFTQTNSSDALNEIESIKIVQVIKNHEPLGATIKFEDVTGNVVISRIMHGGAAHRSGLIGVGDCIHEVNGFALKGRSFQDILSLLEFECRNPVISFKLTPGDYACSKTGVESKLRIKALFDYYPLQDSHHPCPEAGLMFQKGDILHVVSLEDSDWWQAKRETVSNPINCFYSNVQRAGLIPSRQLQERRFAALRDIRQQYFDRKVNEYKYQYQVLKKHFAKYRKVKKTMYRLKRSEDFEREDINVYIDVEKYIPTKGIYRPLVLIGPRNVGRSRLIYGLIARNPKLFQRAVPHTTRPLKESEENGREYYFVDHEWFIDEIRKGNFSEYGMYNGNYYGIHLSSIHSVITDGKVCLIDPTPKALKVIYCPLIKPYVIHVAPPNDINQLAKLPKFKKTSRNLYGLKEKELREMICISERLEFLYGHYFDIILINENEEETLEILMETVKLINSTEQWVPASWIA